MLAICVLLLCLPSARAADLDIVEQRVRERLLSSVASVATVQGYQSSLLANGSWADISYSNTSQTNWLPLTHLSRVHAMARAYCYPAGALYQDATLRADILRAYDFWIADDPSSSNWYYNEISVPQDLGEIMVLMKPDLSAAQKASGILLVKRSYIARSTNSGLNTGANRIDRAYGTILRGILTPDTALTTEAFLAIGDTAVVTTAEGIQPDYSYQQHGAQLYIGGYGAVFIDGILQYGQLGVGTSFFYSDSQMHTFVDFLIDGLTWFARGDSSDLSATGRGVTRKSQTATAGGYGGQLAKTLALNNGYRSAELEVLKTRFQAASSSHTADPQLALSGNRNFWRSDIMTHHRPAFYASVKTSSTRTLQPETGNGEGLKNLHLADGVTQIMRSGNEYDDIAPVWDWRRLPGTTTEQGTYSLKPASDWGVAGNSTHAGGVSDGTCGAVAFNYSRLNVAAKKSWFFFENEFVALGAGINAPSATNAVQTSLNQTLLNGTVTYQNGTGTPLTLASGNVTPAGLKWVHHDGVGYVFATPVSTAKIQATAQTGTWQSINTGYDATVISKNVFSLDLGHGTAVSNGQYAYTVVPGVAATELDAYQAAPPVQVLSNTTTIQAVKKTPSGVTAANFWTDATNSIGGITVNKKSSVLVKNDGRFLDVSVADPTQLNTGTITVQVATPVAGLLTADPGVTVTQLSPGISLTVAVNGSRGKSFHARFYIDAETIETVTLSPVADSFVYDGSAASNYGTADSLVLKQGGAGFNRQSYLRFDLSSITRLPLVADLRLMPTTVQTPGVHAISEMTDHAWTENGVNWNNRPALGTVLQTWTPVLNTPVTASVLGAVETAVAGSGQLSLGLAPVTATADGYVAYASRESTTVANRPQLSLKFLKDLPTVSVTATTATANESGGPPAVFTLTRSGDLSGELVANFTLGGTASAADYALIPTTVTFASGQATAGVSITPVNDSDPEGSESVTLTLSPSAYHEIGTATAVVTILDDEISPIFWDPDGLAANNTSGGLGGSGVWSTSQAAWWNTTSHSPWNNAAPGDVLFRDTAGTVTLSGQIEGRNLYFGSDGYLIGNGGSAANTLALGGATPTLNVTNAGHTATISAALVGTGGITKAGPGTLVLAGANTYAGTTTVSAGTLNVSGDATAADGGWSIGPAAAAATTTNFLAGTTIVVAGGKQIRVGSTGSGTVAQALNVAGTVTNDGTLFVGRPGVVTLNSGAVWTQNGGMSVTGIGGYSASVIVNAGASFAYGGSSTIKLEPGSSGSGTLTLAGGTFTTGRGFERTVVSSTGNGSVILSGGGVLKLSENLPQLTTGAIAFSVGAGGGVIDTGAFSTTLSSAISGSGSLTKQGAGTLWLAGANSYSGDTLVTGGTLALGISNALPAGKVTVNGGTLDLGNDQSDSVGIVTLDSGLITGTGTSTLTSTGSYEVKSGSISVRLAGAVPLNKTTSGTVILGGANTHTGINTIAANGGTLIITHPGALGTGLVKIPKGGAQTGTLALQLTGTNVVNNVFDGFASTTFAGDATPPCIENLSGDNTIPSPLRVTGTGGNGLYVKSSGGFLTLTGQIDHTVVSTRSFGLGGASDGIVTGNILTGSGGFTLVKDGVGTWTLTGSNTYNGATTISGGVLRIGNGGTTGTLGSANVNNNGVLKIERSNAYSISNPISGSGSFIQAGTGTTTLTVANTYTGATRVEKGGLVLPNIALADTATVEISSSALLTLGFTGNDLVKSLTFDGVLQAKGTWGGIGSGADHETARITGSGKLQVITGIEPFVAWMNTSTLPVTADRTAGGDPDNDGLMNFLEFALDGDPASGTASGKMVTRLVDGHLTLTLAVRSSAAFNGSGPMNLVTQDAITYRIEGSTDLSGFTAGVEEIAPITAGLPTLTAGWSYHSFRLTSPVSETPQAFLRAFVSGSP